MSKAIVIFLAVAAMAAGAACSIDNGNDNGGECNNGAGALGEGGGGEGGSGGSAGATTGTGGSGGWTPFSEVVPIDCGGIAMTAPGGNGVQATIEIPDGAYLRWVEVSVTPPPNHEALPEKFPEVKIAVATHAKPKDFATIASTIDTWADLSAYETPHKVKVIVTPDDPGLLINNNGMVYAGFGVGESGENSQLGTVFVGWTCYVHLGTCADVVTGAPLPDGSSCGMWHKCLSGTCQGD